MSQNIRAVPGVVTAPRQHLEGRRVGLGQHVGLVDPGEALDGRAVEADALGEGPLELGGGDGHGLERPEHVGEPQPHEADVALLDGAEDELLLTIHGSNPALVGGAGCAGHREVDAQAWSTDIAALWPGMPLTPPPRRAPAPAMRTRRVGRLDTPGADLGLGSAQGHCSERWKMLPPGSPRSASSSTGVRASRQSAPVGVAQQDVLDRFGQHGVQRVEGPRQGEVLDRGRAPARSRGTAGPAGAGRTASASGRRWRRARARGSSGPTGCGSRSRTAAAAAPGRPQRRHTPPAAGRSPR